MPATLISVSFHSLCCFFYHFLFSFSIINFLLFTIHATLFSDSFFNPPSVLIFLYFIFPPHILIYNSCYLILCFFSCLPLYLSLSFFLLHHQLYLIYHSCYFILFLFSIILLFLSFYFAPSSSFDYLNYMLPHSVFLSLFLSLSFFFLFPRNL